ncbi:hypothetical protein [Porphyromonas sp. COT-239 OH1446]|uniref:hypothetical protein n=1 Tax=Porphyromonas sp. COT-239 OH1446 TaxID=1515613 RepID=UPI00052D65DB|nr:hypothetical protein [Porphyromonas sp. COT-239 OH1446]KGN71306.1 hypothetical protein HQ37_02340 [Porphyromonas sp. COT-239 OH1446]
MDRKAFEMRRNDYEAPKVEVIELGSPMNVLTNFSFGGDLIIDDGGTEFGDFEAGGSLDDDL